MTDILRFLGMSGCIGAVFTLLVSLGGYVADVTSGKRAPFPAIVLAGEIALIGFFVLAFIAIAGAGQ